MTESLDIRFYVYISGAWVRLLDIDQSSMRWGLAKNARLSDIDQLTVVLNNDDGRYTPSGPSALSGWDEGLSVRVDFTHGGATRTKFRGRISRIQVPPTPYDIHATITVLGWMDNATRYPVTNPPLLTNTTINSAINYVLEDIAVRPMNKRIYTGSFTFDRLFDDTREKTRAYTEFSKFVNSELSYVYVRHDGIDGETFVLEGHETRNGTNTIAKISIDGQTRVTEAGDTRVTEAGDTRITVESQDAQIFTKILEKDLQHGQDIINYYPVSAYPKKIDTTPVLIYESDELIYIPAGKTLPPFRIFWTDPTGRRKINAIPPSGTGNVVSLNLCNEQQGAGQSTTSGYFYGKILDETGKTAEINDAPIVAFPVWSKGSAYFDASNAWLQYADSPDWDFGSGDFTFSFWIYPTDANINTAPFSRDGTVSFPAFIIKSDGTNYKIYLSSAGASFDIANGVSMGTIEINEWHHYEVGRSNGTIYTFKDGTLVTSASGSGTLQASSSPLYMGKNGATYFGGNITEWMIVKGECLHTASFTAPTEVPYMRAGLYYEMNTAQDFTGTNVKDKLTITATYGTEGATIESMANTHTAGAWVKLKVYGYGIYINSSVEITEQDSASVEARGEKSINLSQAYQVTTDFGQLEAKKQVEYWRNPRTVLNSISYYPNASIELMRAFLFLDVGDLIPVQITSDGIDANYYIDNINVEMNRGGIVKVTYGLQQAWTMTKGLTRVACEFASGSDMINFGYIPIVSADEHTYRAFSAWIYLDAVTASNDQVIIGTKSNAPGVSFYVDNHATNVLLSFDSTRFVTGGKWSCPANPFSVGGWVHVLAAYNNSSASNDPQIFVNGVSQTITENTTPSGAAVSEEGSELVIGNSKLADSCWNGKLKDIREYDVDQSIHSPQALATGLYNEGAGGNGYYSGMKFSAFCVRTSELTAFTDLTLTTEKLIEGYKGYVGTPSGSPIVRAV